MEGKMMMSPKEMASMMKKMASQMEKMGGMSKDMPKKMKKNHK